MDKLFVFVKATLMSILKSTSRNLENGLPSKVSLHGQKIEVK